MTSILKVSEIQDPTNGNTALTVDASGRVLTPLKPAFHARHVSGSSVGLQGIITFNTEDFDIGGNYDTSNGRFTAPVSGIYFFHFNSLPAENSSGNILADGSALYLSFYKNGAEPVSTSQRSYYRTTGASQYNTIYRTETMQLNANDYIQVNVANKFIYNDASGYYNPVFQGFLIG